MNLIPCKEFKKKTGGKKELPESKGVKLGRIAPSREGGKGSLHERDCENYLLRDAKGNCLSGKQRRVSGE